MRTFTECIPCVLQQMVDVGKKVTDDVDIRHRIMKHALRILCDMPFEVSPPEMALELYEMVHRESGVDDPFADVKSKYNREVLDLYNTFRDITGDGESDFSNGVKLTIAGNIIDFGHSKRPSEIRIEHIIEDTLSRDLYYDDTKELRRSIEKSSTVLYLSDNCGEIVFDRFFIENYIDADTVFVVKSAPIINDATKEDAESVGIHNVARIVENGVIPPAPGTLIHNSSEEFKELFESADTVISKGQGNYETLSGIDREIYFLLKAKCPVIARDAGCNTGDIICRRSE